MHRRHVITACCVSILFLLFVNRRHLCDLAEVADTYSGFYAYLRQQPWALLRYRSQHSGGWQPPEAATHLVPPILHHIFLTDGRAGASLDRYEVEIQSCTALHQNWTHYTWNDTAAYAFIEEHYPTLYPHYVGYGQSIQRANVLRYALLDHYGGVYLDLDIVCRQPLDELRSVPWLSPAAYPAGVNNAFILSRLHHPLAQKIIDELPNQDMRWGFPYVTNMLSTGCMFFSNRWMSYARSLKAKLDAGETVSEADRIYVLADELGHVEPHMLRGVVTTPLFKHGGASTWHGWDAAAIVFIGKHYGYVALIICTVLVNSLMFVALRCWHRRTHRRRSSGSVKSLTRRSLSKDHGEEKC